MKKRHPLFNIFGPLVLAIVVVVAALLIPHQNQQYRKGTLKNAAVSLSTTVFRGQAVKSQAVKAGYVPFLGSSELSRMDSMHPSVLAQKYHRAYQPFLLGTAGTQSLTQYFNINEMGDSLKNKKAVFIISPQWFTRQGQNKNAFASFYSPLATTSWILNTKDSIQKRYAAQRILTMGNIDTNSTLGSALERVLIGQKITPTQRAILRIKQQWLKSEDQMFGNLLIKNWHSMSIDRKAKLLPSHFSEHKLNELAVQFGQRHTSSNRFGIDNRLYQMDLKGQRMKKLRGSQSNFDYRQSPEYGDFELVLNQFAQQHTDVLFIIPPVNSRWARYTGLSQTMLRQTNAKIKYQLQSQGFNHVLDLTDQGHVKYFMQDTIHLGWRGWLAVDQVVRPFMKQKNHRVNYHINSKFYSPKWCNAVISKQ